MKPPLSLRQEKLFESLLLLNSIIMVNPAFCKDYNFVFI